MSASQEHFRLVGGWLNDLAIFVAGKSPIEDVKLKLAAMTGLLASKAPVECFTSESLEFCARKFKFMPSYAELWARLQTFERERSKQLALPAPSTPSAFDPDVEGADLPGADKALVGFWVRDFNAGATYAQLRTSLDIIRGKATEGYRWLTNAKSDAGMRAADIAVRNHWLETQHRWSPPSDVEKDAVTTIARQVYRSVEMRTLDPQPPSGAVLPPKPGAKPYGALTPAQLHDMRMANDALRPIAERQAQIEAERALHGKEFEHALQLPPEFDPGDSAEEPPPFEPSYREDEHDADHGRESTRLRRAAQRAGPDPESEPEIEDDPDDWRPSYLRLVKAT